MDEQRRRKLLGDSDLGRHILSREDAGEQSTQPLSPERRATLNSTPLGREVVRAHDAAHGRDPVSGRFA